MKIFGLNFFRVFAFLLLFLTLGCRIDTWSYEIYDGYTIDKSGEETILLVKNRESAVKIKDEYFIQEFKFNSDALILNVTTTSEDNDNEYYIFTYVDEKIYGPYNSASLTEKLTSMYINIDDDLIKTKDITSEDISSYEGD